MNIRTLYCLQKLRDEFGHGVFGKIAQKLLALAFREIGYTHIVERGVQGVDIDIADETKRYALEVKTTEGLSFVLDESNIDALVARAKDGYVPVIAALRLAPFEKWILAGIPLRELSPGQVLIDRLRAYRLRDVEARVDSAFERVLDKHFNGALQGGQQYLIDELRKTGIEVRDT